MPRVLLSYMGVGNYTETTYRLEEDGRELTTHLIAEALCEWFNPDSLFVLVTEEARNTENYKELQKRCGNKLVGVLIPSGDSPKEMWQIFDAYVEKVKANDTIILDVTHGFRSLPLLGFTVTAFLKRLRGVGIGGIYYGSYEGRDKINNVSPVYNLTPLVELMDWLEGLDAFTRRADAEELAWLLEEAQNIPRKAEYQDKESLPVKLKTVSGDLNTLSKALHLSRPLTVMKCSAKLTNELDQLAQEAARWAPPFGVVLEEINEEIKKFVYESPLQLNKDNLQSQLALVNYYLNKGLLVQAITLMREWLVNLMGLEVNKDSWLSRTGREQIECILNHSNPDKYVPGIEKVWNYAFNLRNDVAHSGMKINPAAPDNIKDRAQCLYKQLVELLNGSAPTLAPNNPINIDVSLLYQDQAKFDELDTYICEVQELAGEGNDVVLTGSGPIWLYLKIAHALHGRVRKLSYTSPVSGEVMVFDHDPF